MSACRQVSGPLCWLLLHCGACGTSAPETSCLLQVPRGQNDVHIIHTEADEKPVGIAMNGQFASEARDANVPSESQLPTCRLLPALCSNERLGRPFLQQQLEAAELMYGSVFGMGGSNLAWCVIASFLLGLGAQIWINFDQSILENANVRANRFVSWWWSPFQFTLPLITMKLYVTLLLIVLCLVLTAPRPGILSTPELVGIYGEHARQRGYPAFPFNEWLLPNLNKTTAESWAIFLRHLRSQMILVWLGFLLHPTLTLPDARRWSLIWRKVLQVSSGLLYGYGAIIFVYFTAISYTYTENRSNYGTMVFTLAATLAVPFFESRPSSNAWLRKFLIFDAVIPVYMCAGVCKVRYVGWDALFSGSWFAEAITSKRHCYSLVPWINVWMVSQKPLGILGTVSWPCVLLSFLTMFFEILLPAYCIASTGLHTRPSFLWQIYFLLCIAFHIQVMFQLGPNWLEQMLLCIFACDPLRALQRRACPSNDLSTVPVAKAAIVVSSDIVDIVQAAFGYLMLIGWCFVQIWSDLDHLVGNYPWNKNHEPFLPVPEMDLYAQASDKSCYKSSLFCTITLFALLCRKMQSDLSTGSGFMASKRPCGCAD